MTQQENTESAALEDSGAPSSVAPRRRTLLICAGALVAVAICVGAWWWTSRQADDGGAANGSEASAVGIPDVGEDEVEPAVYRLIQAERTTLALNTDQAEGWGRLGMTFYAHNLIEPALECFERAESIDPKAARWPYLRGMILSETDRSIGVTHVRRAAELAPDSVEMRMRLGEFYLDLQQLADSQACFEAVRSRDPQNARALIGLARIAAAEQAWDDALSFAEQANQAAPQRDDIVRLLGQIELRLGHTAEARRYGELLEQLPTAGQWPDAILGQVYALRVDTNKLSDEAAVYLQQNRMEQFFQTLDRLIELEPEEAQWHVWLARTLLRSQNLDGAAQVLDRALKQVPDSPEVGFLRAVVHNNVGEHEIARRRLDHVLAIKPDYPEAHYHMAFALRNLDRPEQSMASLRQVLQYEPDYAPAHLDLGELLLAAGQADEAIPHLEKALELSPQSVGARALLEQARKK